MPSKWFSAFFPQSPALKEALRPYLVWNLSYDSEMKNLNLTMGEGERGEERRGKRGGREGRRVRGKEGEGGSFFNDLIWYKAASLLQAGSDAELAVLVSPRALSLLPPHPALSAGSCKGLPKVTCTKLLRVAVLGQGSS